MERYIVNFVNNAALVPMYSTSSKLLLLFLIDIVTISNMSTQT